MNEWLKWNIRFTSFMPLWISIVIKEIFSMVKRYQELLAEYADIPFAKEDILAMFSIELLVIGILLLGSIVGTLTLSLSLRRYPKSQKDSRIGQIVWAKRADHVGVDLLVAYMLPLIAFDFTELEGIILFLIYFWIVCIFGIHNNYYFANLLLDGKGYHMYQCDITCDCNRGEQTYYGVVVLSKRNLAVSSIYEIRYKGNDKGIFLDM